MVDDLEARAVLPPRKLEVVHRGEVDQHVEAQVGVDLAEAECLAEHAAVEDRRVLAEGAPGLEDGGPKPLPEPCEDALAVHL